MTPSKRFTLTIIAGIILTIIAGFAVYRNMEMTASACVAGIMAILSTYIWGETHRPTGRRKRNDQTADV